MDGPTQRGRTKRIGVVLVGPLEERDVHRLGAPALESAAAATSAVVYVDRGPSHARAQAEALGLDVVTTGPPRSLARARNRGYERLRQLHPELAYVQFLAVDDVLRPGWLEVAETTLDEDPELFAVCGQRTALAPEASVFRRVFDVQWRSEEPGPIARIGSDVVIRCAAFDAVGGYQPGLIAGESEIGIRLRHHGGKLARLKFRSTERHTDVESLEDWWAHARRQGMIVAQLYRLHGAPPERGFAHEMRRLVLWGAVIPGVALGLTVPTLGLSWVLLGAYPYQFAKKVRKAKARGVPWVDALVWAASRTLESIPEAVGAATYHLDRLKSSAGERKRAKQAIKPA